MSEAPPSYEDLEAKLAHERKMNEGKTRIIHDLLQERYEEKEYRPVEKVEISIRSYDMYHEDKFLPQRLVDEIIGQAPSNYLVTPISEKGGDVIFRYHEDKGIYRPDGIPWAENLVKKVFGELVRTGHLGQVVKLMQVSTYRFENEAFTEDQDHIIVLNGALNIYTKELKPFSPDYQSLSRIPVKFDPDAKCPKIMKFLKEVAPKAIPFIQEWAGYHLLKDYRFQKSLMCIGSGANGKTTYLKLMEKFLGKENVSHESLYQLSSIRFSPAELYGKLANIAPDISSDELKRTGVFKALTGGDRQRGERKHQNAFYFFNHAKLSFSCNQLPTTPDMSYAFFRRWVPLVFSQVFEGEKADPNIIDKITTPEELCGFLSWSLEGLDRLLENGEFSETPSTLEIQELWEEMQDPVNAFVKKCVTRDPDGKVTKDDFYLAYRNFCSTFGHVALSKNTLTTKLKGLISNLGDAKPTFKGGVRKPSWTNINLFCGLLKDACQGCQGSQGSPFLDNLSMQTILKEIYTDLDDLADLADHDTSLQNKLEEFLKILGDVERSIMGEPVEFSKFITELVTQGWKKTDVKKVHDILVRDGMIFSPRPDYIKSTGGT